MGAAVGNSVTSKSTVPCSSRSSAPTRTLLTMPEMVTVSPLVVKGVEGEV